MLFTDNGKMQAAFKSYYESHFIDFSLYDVIEMSDKELNNLVNEDTREDILEDGEMCIIRPSLNYFILKVLDSDGKEISRILFKDTAIKMPFAKDYDGRIIDFVNYLDVFIYENAFEEPIHKLTIGCAFSIDGKNIYSFERCMDENYFVSFTEDGEGEVADFDMKRIKLIYMAIQKMLFERPSVFVQSAVREIPMGVKIKKTKKQKIRKRIVKTVKVLQLNKPEFNEYVGKHRIITCPSWGVIGHTRTLKSGKQIWINPYRKGKERNNPNVYSSKEYDLVMKNNVAESTV